MIKKYIENTEEVRQRLTRMLMDDASDMCRYQRDIYMYIDEDGQARLDWFVNVGGNSWLDDDHILLYVCLQHYEGIEDSIDGTTMLADLIDLTDEELADAVCRDAEIDREDLDAVDCYKWAFEHYGDTLRAWYDACIEAAVSEYADHADEIMRRANRFALERGHDIEDNTGRTAVVWLFVLNAEDQFRYEMQGGESNG